MVYVQNVLDLDSDMYNIWNTSRFTLGFWTKDRKGAAAVMMSLRRSDGPRRRPPPCQLVQSHPGPRWDPTGGVSMGIFHSIPRGIHASRGWVFPGGIIEVEFP